MKFGWQVWGPVLTVLSVVWQVEGAYDLGYGSDDDLTSFKTRPEFRLPLFQVDQVNPERVTPGYWFIAPYGNIMQEMFPRRYYQACQTGPAIYDGNGDLVWTGACELGNINTCDFRLFEFGDRTLLSGIMMSDGQDDKGRGLIWDSTFTNVKNVSVPKLMRSFNMHEFLLVDGGKHALYILYRPEEIELNPELAEETGLETGWISNMGIREVDVDTNATLFEWWAYPDVQPHESKVLRSNLEGPHPSSWNWFHMNSIDKNSAGDYMISSRFTDTIFKVSGKTGKVEWRLEGSGKMSNFVHQDAFNFSRQHDARWLEHRDDYEVISFLDNAADSNNETSTYSSTLIVELDKTSSPWTARVRRRWIRPDDGLSRLRGNAQILPNGNAFTCWSGNSYLSEHSPEGELLMTASFRDHRFVTYRGYKFNFTGTPVQSPVLKAETYGIDPDRSTTVSYVSWNGATEVVSWNFYRASNVSHDVLLGSAPKTGFETSLHSDGYAPAVYAEALAANGTVLGRTSSYIVERPKHWPVDATYPDSPSKPVASMVEPDGHEEIGPPDGLDDMGCSVYGSGCSPRQHRQQPAKIDIVPTGKTEL